MNALAPVDPFAGVLPPRNERAEQALLGALLANNRAFDRVADFLQPEHFADPVHGAIFGAIARHVSAGRIADPTTLRAEFEGAGTLRDVGGTAYLATLLSAMVGIINAGDYGRVIHDAWMRRELIGVCTDAVNTAYAPEGMSGPDQLEMLEASLTRIATGAGDVRPAVPAAAAVTSAVEQAVAGSQRASSLAGISTGYAALDRMTGGLLPGEVYLIGARPGMGKTGLSMGIAARAASLGVPTGMWSGEMAAVQLGARLSAAYLGLDVQSVFRGKGWVLPDNPLPGQQAQLQPLPASVFDQMVEMQRVARDLPLVFDDRSGITVAALRARARRWKRERGLKLLVVDYVALLKASMEMQRRGLYEQVTELSRDIKLLAGELEVPVVACAQLSRGNERRENKMPQLSDLRDSGALEQDAYCVMFIHRPHYYLMQEGEPTRSQKESSEQFEDRCDVWKTQVAQSEGQALVNVAKNRGGPTGITRLKFRGESIWFRDESESDLAPAWGPGFGGGFC